MQSSLLLSHKHNSMHALLCQASYETAVNAQYFYWKALLTLRASPLPFESIIPSSGCQGIARLTSGMVDAGLTQSHTPNGPLLQADLRHFLFVYCFIDL